MTQIIILLALTIFTTRTNSQNPCSGIPPSKICIHGMHPGKFNSGAVIGEFTRLGTHQNCPSYVKNRTNSNGIVLYYYLYWNPSRNYWMISSSVGDTRYFSYTQRFTSNIFGTNARIWNVYDGSTTQIDQTVFATDCSNYVPPATCQPSSFQQLCILGDQSDDRLVWYNNNGAFNPVGCYNGKTLYQSRRSRQSNQSVTYYYVYYNRFFLAWVQTRFTQPTNFDFVTNLPNVLFCQAQSLLNCNHQWVSGGRVDSLITSGSCHTCSTIGFSQQVCLTGRFATLNMIVNGIYKLQSSECLDSFPVYKKTHTGYSTSIVFLGNLGQFAVVGTADIKNRTTFHEKAHAFCEARDGNITNNCSHPRSWLVFQGNESSVSDLPIGLNRDPTLRVVSCQNECLHAPQRICVSINAPESKITSDRCLQETNGTSGTFATVQNITGTYEKNPCGTDMFPSYTRTSTNHEHTSSIWWDNSIVGYWLITADNSSGFFCPGLRLSECSGHWHYHSAPFNTSLSYPVINDRDSLFNDSCSFIVSSACPTAASVADNNPLPSGIIVAIVVAILLLCFVIVVGVLYWRKFDQEQKENRPNQQLGDTSWGSPNIAPVTSYNTQSQTTDDWWFELEDGQKISHEFWLPDDWETRSREPTQTQINNTKEVVGKRRGGEIELLERPEWRIRYGGAPILENTRTGKSYWAWAVPDVAKEFGIEFKRRGVNV